MEKKSVKIVWRRKGKRMERLDKVMRYLFLTVIFTLIGPVAYAIEPDAPEQLISRADAISINIQENLSAKFRKEPANRKKDHGALVSFYTDRGFKPLWVTDDGLSKKARALIAGIRQADEFGLDSMDYDLPDAGELKSYWGYQAKWLADSEIKLGYALLAYARHARGGRLDPNKLSRYIDYKPPLLEPLAVLEAAEKTDAPKAYLADLHPKHVQFVRLKKALAEEREKTGETKTVVNIPSGPSLKHGMTHSQIVLLRKRLGVPAPSGDEETEANSANFFDDQLMEAVAAFQKKKGLKADGIVGRHTRRAMNKRPRNRVKTIVANMERWRWMPEYLGKRYVQVNVPEFRFRVMSGSKLIHTERIVAGKITNKTPIFSDEMETVVFNPSWYPPVSIIRNEILPGARSNPDFIYRHKFQLTNARGRPINPDSVDWYEAEAGQIFFRQPPGPGNVLGVVKFLFPNRHQVYMHDTPSKSLFDKRVRAYSHGCMRIRDPRKFAELILGYDKGWSRTRIDKIIRSGINQPVKLTKKVPVHITYFTAQVGDDGKLTFVDDIYKHDKRVMAALAGQPLPPEPRPRVAPPKPRDTFRRRNPFSNSFFNRVFQF